jgi:hypothetical protein|tara:strand:+ start:2465 stop:2806 length:342 start_codon:yes stop_codon:yes gene_type:complete
MDEYEDAFSPEEGGGDKHQNKKAFDEVFGLEDIEEEIHGNEKINWKREYWVMRQRAISYERAYDGLLNHYFIEKGKLQEVNQKLWRLENGKESLKKKPFDKSILDDDLSADLQ